MIAGVAAGAVLAAQDVPPLPPAAPTPAAVPAQAAPPAPARPVATPAPAPVAAPFVVTLENDWSDQARENADRARERADQAREQAQQIREQSEQIREQARQAAERAREDSRFQLRDFHIDVPPISLNLDLSPQQVGGRGAPARIYNLRDGSLYGRGQTALDDHKYDVALDDFTEVVARGGPNADGALYWKAYTLNKLGRRDESVATIGQLRTSFPQSHWLEDAKALELEVKQAAGKPVSPDSESDDELKLMALNGLSRTDPARAFPAIEKLLKGPASPALKKRAIFVLASNNAPQAQQMLEQIARGNSNPDLQLTAIRYMLDNKQFPNRTATLYEIYGSTNNVSVKREIINALRNNNDTEHLVQIYKTEKDSDLRASALSGLGDRNGNAELWTLYQGETTPEGKIQILNVMYNSGNVERLYDVARTDKDSKVRIKAIEVLSQNRAANLGEMLTNLYGSEQDVQVKRAILNQISSQRNAKALVDMYHKENNFELKKTILTHLGNMRTAEANELYMEILSK